MKCQDVRRFLYAFGDGALEVKDNLEILGHLNMCPRCAARLDADQQLKLRLAATFGAESAPDHLRESILAELRPAAPMHRARQLVRFAPMLAAAAVLAIAAGIWWSQSPADAQRTAQETVASIDLEQPVSAREVSAAFRVGHMQCSALGRAHHRADLSRHLPKLQQELAAELGVDVLAPNWHRKSLRFVSACTCGIPSGAEGAHLVYERLHVRTASLYSLRPTDLIDALERDVLDGKEYRVGHSDGHNLIAWHGRNTDYLLCVGGESDGVEKLVRDLVAPIRVALAETGIDPLAELVLARADLQDRVPDLFGPMPNPAMLVLSNGEAWFIDPQR